MIPEQPSLSQNSGDEHEVKYHSETKDHSINKRPAGKYFTLWAVNNMVACEASNLTNSRKVWNGSDQNIVFTILKMLQRVVSHE